MGTLQKISRVDNIYRKSSTLLVIREKQIKALVQYHYTPTRIAKIIKTDSANEADVGSDGNPNTPLETVEIISASWQ